MDDVLATGGTAAAAVQLVKGLGASLEGLAFLIELDFLNGKTKLAGERVHSVLHISTHRGLSALGSAA